MISRDVRFCTSNTIEVPVRKMKENESSELPLKPNKIEEREREFEDAKEDTETEAESQDEFLVQEENTQIVQSKPSITKLYCTQL